MRNHMACLLFLAVLIIACVGTIPYLNAQQQNSLSSKKKNILFIAVDDLRPELGCYGASYMQTPHIDHLAAQGLVFENAYCQQAVCAPSRNSVMTGLRPDAIKIYDLEFFFSQNSSRCHYSTTTGVGKILGGAPARGNIKKTGKVI